MAGLFEERGPDRSDDGQVRGDRDVLIPLSPLGELLGFIALPPALWLLLVVVVATYLALVEVVKRRFSQHGY